MCIVKGSEGGHAQLAVLFPALPHFFFFFGLLVYVHKYTWKENSGDKGGCNEMLPGLSHFFAALHSLIPNSDNL